MEEIDKELGKKIITIINIGLNDPTSEQRSPDGVHPNFVLYFYKEKQPAGIRATVLRKGESILINKEEIDEIIIKEQE